MLELWAYRNAISEARLRRRDGRRLVDPAAWRPAFAASTRRTTALLATLDGRYWPEIHSGHLFLKVNMETAWRDYRAGFDPAAALERIAWTAEELGPTARSLLDAADKADPLSGPLSELVRRLPPSSWKHLSGSALVALDFRQAAEMILRCIADLEVKGHDVGRGAVEAELEHDRLSTRRDSLNTNLSRLGLSPIAKAVLVVEGETEEMVVPHVRRWLGIPEDPQTLQVIALRGVTRDVTKLAAAVAGPIVVRSERDGTLVLDRPPTYVALAVDPEGSFSTQSAVDRQRRLLVDELTAIVRAQGYEPDTTDLEALITVKVWPEREFEFAHYTDEELADGILKLSRRQDRDELLRSLAKARTGDDRLSEVLPSRTRKPRLNEVLLPTLESKVCSALAGRGAMPPIAERVLEAFRLGARTGPGSWHIRGSPRAE